MRHLAWLDMDHTSGQEYWLSMNLAGDYARACHDQIHKNVAKSMGLKSIGKIENHHNFAWKEIVDGQEMIVHRKGATPAGKDVLGIIPGSMTDPGFIVKGKGNIDSINSASHGAGRRHSRKETKSRNTKSAMRKQLLQNDVALIGGALDESPYAYKNLEQVMSYQTDLVDTIGKFTPRIVRMDRDK
jgi:tRNA-splicing ligase RtcB